MSLPSSGAATTQATALTAIEGRSVPRLISDRVAWRASMAVIAAGSAVSLAYADIIVTEGMQPWYLCATCHSLDGISAMARFPKLAGQRARGEQTAGRATAEGPTRSLSG